MFRYLTCLLALLPTLCLCNDPFLDKSSFQTLLSQEEIRQGIRQVAREIDRDFQGEEITVLAVLKGAMFVAVDLTRELDSPCTVECIKASSYGMGGTKRGELSITGLEKINLEGKNVLVVEDIFDTGATLSSIMGKLKELRPKTLRSFVLLMKDVEHLTNYRPDYCLFHIDDHFVIGYGLDYKEYWRNLSDILYVPNDPVVD